MSDIPNPKLAPLAYLRLIAADVRAEKGQTAANEVLDAIGAINSRIEGLVSELDQIRLAYDASAQHGHSIPAELYRAIMESIPVALAAKDQNS
jgi:hypothetical protein